MAATASTATTPTPDSATPAFISIASTTATSFHHPTHDGQRRPATVVVGSGGQRAAAGASHAIGITADGVAYSWGRSSRCGQLGRPGRASVPAPVVYQTHARDESSAAVVVVAQRAYVGGQSDSGHSAIVNDAGDQLWVSGCDRWQQLGLGSALGGASGYTWKNGKVFQNEFVENTFVLEYLRRLDPTATIRDVAIGGDHTVVLSSNQRDVVTFGKGAEGQLGLSEKRFVSAPTKSSVLSTNGESTKIAAVCASDFCTWTLDHDGNVLKNAGQCRTTQELFWKAMEVCQQDASRHGLTQVFKE